MIGSFDDPVGPKPATRLSRKDWLSRSSGAVLRSVPGVRCAPGSRPAGLVAEVGLRWWRLQNATPPHYPRTRRKPTEKAPLKRRRPFSRLCFIVLVDVDWLRKFRAAPC